MSRIAFNFFGIDIYYYSLCILLGVLTAYILIINEAKKNNISKSFMDDLIFYSLLVGIIGARVYFVLFNIGYYLQNPLQIFAVWNGGLAIHGGLISGCIFIYFYTKNKNKEFLKILDIVVPAILIAQAIGRWGNFFNKEAYGSMTTLISLQNLHIPNFIINGMYIDGNYYYPTFFFESVWCIIGFILLILIRKKKSIKAGTLTSVYLIHYGIGRFFIESLRTDSLMFLSLKVAQIVSIIGIIIGIVLIIFLNVRKDKKNDI